MYITIGILCLILFVTLFNVITAPTLAKIHLIKNKPFVSLLIPARNEAANIENCLYGLLKQNYTNYEIIVLDDQSSDETAAIVHGIMQTHSNIQLLSGQPLPDGWLGKNWACHQLSQYSSGDILIFTDADTQHQPHTLSATLGWIEKKSLGMFSAFVEQETPTLPEKLAVQLIHTFVYATLPLWMTYYSKSPSTVAANGQWICFTKAAYKQLGGHEKMRQAVVEDMAFARAAKNNSIPQLTASGVGAIHCRMYTNASQVWSGFSKNLFGIVNNNLIGFWFMLSLLFLTGIFPFVALFFANLQLFALIAIAFMFSIRALIALRFAQPFWSSTLLHPIAAGYVIAIGLNSLIKTNSQKPLIWKDREIHL